MRPMTSAMAKMTSMPRPYSLVYAIAPLIPPKARKPTSGMMASNSAR